MAKDIARQQDYAAKHAAILSDMLDRPTRKEVPQRIWRLRFWRPADVYSDAAYVVATLCQNLNVPAAPNQPIPKVQVDVCRPYTEIVGALGPIIQLNLFGSYSVHQIVAFLRLDTLAPETVEWIDETHYSDIFVVGTPLTPMRNN